MPEKRTIYGMYSNDPKFVELTDQLISLLLTPQRHKLNAQTIKRPLANHILEIYLYGYSRRREREPVEEIERLNGSDKEKEVESPVKSGDKHYLQICAELYDFILNPPEAKSFGFINYHDFPPTERIGTLCIWLFSHGQDQRRSLESEEVRKLIDSMPETKVGEMTLF